MTLREIIHKAIDAWAIQPQCDKLGAHEVDEATDAVLAALPAQPPAPLLSDEERGRLVEMADRLEEEGESAPNDWLEDWPKRDAQLLRNLASQEHREEEKHV